jgi:hypothetical protein
MPTYGQPLHRTERLPGGIRLRPLGLTEVAFRA